MAAERRTEGQEGEEAEGGMNGRGSPVLMAIDLKQEGGSDP